MEIVERYNDPQENARVAEDALQARIWTMLPGIVQSVTVSGGVPVASVQLAIKGYDNHPDGTRTFHDLPILPHCPIVFPRGGGYSMTFPIKKGDECMVQFASRSIDEWWQTGKGQPPYDFRKHDLSDGVCFVGLTSRAKPLSGISTSTAQFRSDDGATLVELNASGHAVRIVGSGGITLDGPVHVTGAITADSTITAKGDVKAGGISLQNHKHSGVQPGGGMTGGPQ